MLNFYIKSVTSHDNGDDWVSCHESIHPQRILYHSETQEYIQEHLFIGNPASSSTEMQLYQNRRIDHSQLPYISHVDVVNDIYKVWVEYIPCRLSNLEGIDSLTAIIILKEAAKGFQKLCGMGWYLNVSEEMILFNTFGFVKVWFSKYLYSNTPRSHQILNEFQQSQQSRQAVTIRQLVALIASHLQSNQAKQSFQELGQNSKTFSELQRNIQDYAVLHNLALAQRVNLKALEIDEESKHFINILQPVQTSPNRCMAKHRPNQSSLNALRISRKSKERDKRLSLMNIDTECVSRESSNLPTPNRNISNQRLGENNNILKFPNQRNSTNDVVNERFYPDGAKVDVGQGLFASGSNKNQISETKRVESEYNIQKLEFSRLKFKNMRKEIMRVEASHVQILNPNLEPVSSRFEYKSSSVDKTEKKLCKSRENNRSLCQLVKPTLEGRGKRVSEHTQLNFNQKCHTPSKLNNRNNTENSRGLNQYNYQFQNIPQQHFDDIRDDLVLNQIEAQFQEFLKTSETKKSSHSAAKGKKPKEVPNLQFSRIKQPKAKPSNNFQTKRFQYSNFYSQEVDIRNSLIRAQTSRQKPATKLLSSNRSTTNFYPSRV